MCRRVIQPNVTAALAAQLSFDPQIAARSTRPERTVTPGEGLLAIRFSPKAAYAATPAVMQWGFGDPRRPRDLHYNARSETAADKPTFSRAFLSRRCLVPVTTLWEFPRYGQPVRLEHAHGETLALAGIWTQRDPNRPNTKMCAVLTSAPNALVARYHHRMPVLIPPESYAEWLDPTTPESRLRQLTAPTPWTQVKAVNCGGETHERNEP